MNMAVEVSLYPVGKEHLRHPVRDFVALVEKRGCTVATGPMSSIVSGSSKQVFEALRVGYEQAVRESGCVMILKASNVCPL